MQYEIVSKVMGGVHVILAFLESSPAAQTAQKMEALGTGTVAPLVAQCLLTNTWPETRQQYKHTSKQVQILRNSMTIHKNSKQN